VLKVLASECAATWQSSRRFQARFTKVMCCDEQVLMVQPLTFMNRSGDSVVPLLRYHGVSTDDLVVVLDDADLPLGRLRVKPAGSSGGHRGLASIIETLGTENFTRIRLGVGRVEGSLRNYVLRAFVGVDLQSARSMIAQAANAVQCVLRYGVDEAMNRYNGCDAPVLQPSE